MRKMALFLAVVLLLSVFALPAQAAQPRISSVIPELTISGNTATCNVQVIGDDTSDVVKATIKLWRGSTCVATWNRQSTGYIFFSQTKNVATGYTYTLTVDASVNGESFPRVSVSDNS